MTNEHAILIPGQNIFACLCCGQSYAPALPCPVDMMAAMMVAFQKMHDECEEGPGGLACIYCLQFGHAPKDCKLLKVTTPMEWMQGPDTGISSKCIWHVMNGTSEIRDTHTPRDPSDFGRCYRMLKLFPQWRSRLDEVAERFPRWTALVREWDELTRLYEEEEPSGRCPKLYRRMKELIKESEGLL